MLVTISMQGRVEQTPLLTIKYRRSALNLSQLPSCAPTILRTQTKWKQLFWNHFRLMKWEEEDL